MKNLEIFLHDNTKVFEAVISNNNGIMAIHRNSLMPSLEKLINSVIEGTYKIEFEKHVLDTSSKHNTFERIELFKSSEDFKINFDTITPSKILNYVYGDEIPYHIGLLKIAKFFHISLEHSDNIKGIGEALYQNNNFIVHCKTNLHPPRKRFTIAHELGHIFLHFSTDKQDAFVDYGEEFKAVNNTNYQDKPLRAARYDDEQYNCSLEQEANKFANELLVDRAKLHTYINEFDYLGLTKPKISKIAELFHVSKQTAYYALKSSNLLDKVDNDTKPKNI